MTAGQHKAMDNSKVVNALKEQLKKVKASIRAKVEHPCRVLKCQFGHHKECDPRLAKNPNQLLVKFAMSNRWMVRTSFAWVSGMSAPAAQARPENRPSLVGKGRNRRQIQRCFHYANIHALTRTAAGLCKPSLRKA